MARGQMRNPFNRCKKIMTDTSTAPSQEARDLAYAAACREAGIEPMLPKYCVFGKRGDSEHDFTLEALALAERTSPDGRVDILDELEPETPPEIPDGLRDPVERLLDVLWPAGRGGKTVAGTRAAGLRVLCLKWLLGRLPKPLAHYAVELGISRAVLSYYVRQLEDALGIHARGQKTATFPEKQRRLKLAEHAARKEAARLAATAPLPSE